MQTFVWEAFPHRMIRGHGEHRLNNIRGHILNTIGIMPIQIRSHKDTFGNYKVKFSVREEDVLYCYRRIELILKENRELVIYDENDEVFKTRI
ncbi:MAG: hypothetical protein WCS17_04410 [Prevotella sp.]